MEKLSNNNQNLSYSETTIYSNIEISAEINKKDIVIFSRLVMKLIQFNKYLTLIIF